MITYASGKLSCKVLHVPSTTTTTGLLHALAPLICLRQLQLECQEIDATIWTTQADFLFIGMGDRPNSYFMRDSWKVERMLEIEGILPSDTETSMTIDLVLGTFLARPHEE